MAEFCVTFVQLAITVFSLIISSNGFDRCTTCSGYTPYFDFTKCQHRSKCITRCKTFKEWRLSDAQLLYVFPIDKIESHFIRITEDAIFAKVSPTPLKTTPKLAAYSLDALETILDIDTRVTNQTNFIDFVSGNIVLPETIPLAHRYGGHQFGYWSDQLGDGRAVLLGEYVNNNGEHWELQLKGSGLTPYSRRGDGRAVIRSSVREFLVSEAFHYLNIPTTRAATLIVSEDPVIRDQFYDGRIKQERAAVVLRLAQSWFRIGSLEILTYYREINLLRNLTDFIIINHFPNIDPSDENRYLSLYTKIVSQTAAMIAKWMSIGFAHGVMNTDNFSLLSITMDYGPFGFLDAYNPSFVPNSSDDEHRYSYEKQPDVGYFNLNKLKIALLPLLTSNQALQMETILKGYITAYKQSFMDIFCRKLGLKGVEEDLDEYIVALLLKIMQDEKVDFTMMFRNLGDISINDLVELKVNTTLWALMDAAKSQHFRHWVKEYKKRVDLHNISDAGRRQMMHKTNPRYILRNWIAQNIIENVEKDNFVLLRTVLDILKKPFTKQEVAETLHFADRPPNWASKLKVSCSS